MPTVQIELDELRRLLREGMESGPAIDAEPVLSRLESKYSAMARQRKNNGIGSIGDYVFRF